MKVFMVTGEVSGDKHGAHLAKALKKICPHVQLHGIGGEMMKEAGVDIITDIRHLNAFQYRYLPRFFFRHRLNQIIRMFCNFIKEEGCDIVVMIGLADDTTYISMKMAGLTKNLGIPIFYYYAPHVWMWSSGKTKKVAEKFDCILTLFPQEERNYRDAGARTIFIGHPVVDEIEAGSKNGNGFLLKKNLGFRDKKVIVFFPGSRRGEIKYHLPIIKKIIGEISQDGRFGYIVSAVNDDFKEKIERYFHSDESIKVLKNNIYHLIDCADFIIAASGTITLEVALKEKPLIVFYRVPWITYLIGISLLKFEYIGMPNVIMEKKIVPEFLQGKIEPRCIAHIALNLLNDQREADLMRMKLRELKRSLGGAGATGRAAKAIIDFVNRK